MLASGVLFGVAAGWLLGGRLARLVDLHLAWWPVLAFAFGIRLLAPVVGDSLVAFVIGFVGIVVVSLANRNVPGMLFICAGASLNLLIVLLNGAMPVDEAAARTAGVQIPVDGLHRPMRDGNVLSWLADRIPIPIVGRVFSPGDLLLAVGGFWVPFAWMRHR